MMPGDNVDYFGRLNEANSSLDEARLLLREATKRRDALRSQVAGEEPVFGFSEATVSLSSAELQQIEARLASLKQQLDQSLLQYTEKHPDIVSLRSTIEQLEGQKEDELARLSETSPQGQSPLNANPVYQQMRVSLSNAEAQVAALSTRVAEYKARVEELDKLAGTVPEVEAELARLNRDYGLHKNNYQELLQRREAARMSQEVERTGDDIKLRVIEPPRLPLVPTGPNRFVLFSMVFLASLGAGAGLTFILAQLKPRFFSIEDIRDSIDLPILGAVSLVTNDRYQRERRIEVLAFSAGICGIFAIYSILTLIGMNQPGVYESFHNLVERII